MINQITLAKKFGSMDPGQPPLPPWSRAGTDIYILHIKLFLKMYYIPLLLHIFW